MTRIAVITPYFREPVEWLAHCHESVRAQGVEADHWFVADGVPNDAVARWDVRHVVLPQSHGDGGSMPRGIGCVLAEAAGYDHIAFLDADNWYHPGHLASLLALRERTQAAVCTSFRTYHQPDGTPIAVTEAAEDQLQHVDTSCFLFHRSAFEVLTTWCEMPRQLWLLCDRVILAALRHKRFVVASTRERTVAYRTLYETHYRPAGLPLPANHKPADVLRPSIEWLLSREGVSESVRRLGFWPMTYF